MQLDPDLRMFDTESNPPIPKTTINPFMSFISGENTCMPPSHWCFVLFFTSTTMCFFWFCLQRCDINPYMKAKVRWLNYRNNTPGSLSLIFPSCSFWQTKTGPADLDRFALLKLTSVKNHQKDSRVGIYVTIGIFRTSKKLCLCCMSVWRWWYF